MVGRDNRTQFFHREILLTPSPPVLGKKLPSWELFFRPLIGESRKSASAKIGLLHGEGNAWRQRAEFLKTNQLKSLGGTVERDVALFAAGEVRR
jgi:hypothetical protein